MIKNIFVVNEITHQEKDGQIRILLGDVIEKLIGKQLTKEKIVEILKLNDCNKKTYINSEQFINLLTYCNDTKCLDILDKCSYLLADQSEEFFVPMYGYEKYYQISNFGRIVSLRTNIFISLTLLEVGYYSPTVYGDDVNKKKRITVQTLMAKTFYGIPDKERKLKVDHIDGNKINNYLNNLRYVSHSINVLNGYQTGNNKGRGKAIYKMGISGKILKKYKSAAEAGRDTGISAGNISNCCVGRVKTAGGYTWKHCEPDKKIVLEKDEILKDIPKINGQTFSKYQVSNYGKIKNTEKNKFLKPSVIVYCKVILTSDIGKKQTFKIHKLVALIFLKIPEDYNVKKYIVNHLDEIKTNNHYKNLEWATLQRNASYSLGKPVIQLDMNTNKIINTFDCIKSALRSLNRGKCCNSKIAQCCNGGSITAYGYKWEWLKSK